jgi:hypothetical protein
LKWTGTSLGVNLGANAPGYTNDVVGTYRYQDTFAQNGYELAPGTTNIVTSYNRTTAAWLPLRQRALTHEFFCDGSLAATFTAAGNLAFINGKGIDFSATPGAGTSELLNDYEEGTWTPSLVPGTSGSITLTTAQAKYTKVGRAVTVTGICEVASVSSPVGALLLQGLPFTNSADASSRSAAAIYATGLAAGATTSIVGRIIPSETQIRIEKFAAGSAAAMAGDVQANTIIQFSLTYFV